MKSRARTFRMMLRLTDEPRSNSPNTMITSLFNPVRRARLFRSLGLVLAVGGASLLRSAEEGARKTFFLPVGSAAQTLKQFAEQSGRGVVFVAAAVQDVRTNAVQGELAPVAALRQMLAGTPLVAEEDKKTGAFAVRKGVADPNGQRAALATTQSDRPAPNAKDENRPADSDDPTLLSPFVVNTERDTGWSANDTLSATRTKQNLKDVPVSIDAITADFMEDLGLATAEDVSRFVANVYAQPRFENDNDDNHFAFRGMFQRFNISRNYFRWYVPTDNYNVERIDFGKGSNSLIFGDVEPGGQGAVFTKRARFKNFGSVMAQYFDNDGYRLQVDLNRRVTDKLALRFNAVDRQDKLFPDFTNYALKAQTLTATWQPFLRTQIRVEGEKGDFLNARGYDSMSVNEQSARSRAFSNVGWYYTSDGQIIQQSTLPSADRSSSNGPAGGSLSLLDTGFVDVTMRNAAGDVTGTKRINGFPRHYNIRGTFDRFKQPFDDYTVTVEQSIGNLGLELSYNHQNREGDRNDNSFGVISVDVNGRLYTDAWGTDTKRLGNDVDAFHFTATYPWQPLSWMKQQLVVSAEYREDFTNYYRQQLYNWAPVDNGTAKILTGSDRVRFRLYLDDPAFYSKAVFDKFLLKNLPTTSTFRAAPYAVAPAADAGTEWRQASAVGFSASGSYFKGRLQSTLGLRWDWNKTKEYQDIRRTADGQSLPPPRPQDSPEGDYRYNPNLDLFHTSYTAGLTYALTRGLNVYAVYSDSFRWQDARTFDNKVFGPILGKTKEVGLKGNLWGDKLSVTLGAFHIDRRNDEFRWTPQNFTADNVEDLMNPNNILPGDPRYITSWHDLNQFRSLIANTTSKGFDLTLLARPLPGLQTRFTLAKAAVITGPDFSTFRAFLEAAKKRGDEAPALIAKAQLVLDSNDFTTKPLGSRYSEWSASWIVDYAFAREAWRGLRGVRAGISGSWRDNYLFGIRDNVEFTGGALHQVDAYVMRDQKIWGQQVRLRLGVKHFADLENSHARKTGFTTKADTTNVYTYGYIEPRVFDLTVTVRF